MSQQHAVYELSLPKKRLSFRPQPKRSVSTRNNFRLCVNETQKHLYASGIEDATERHSEFLTGAEPEQFDSSEEPVLSPQERERYLKMLVQRAFSEYLAQQDAIVSKIGFALKSLNQQAFEAFKALAEESAINFRLNQQLVQISNSDIGAEFSRLRSSFKACGDEIEQFCEVVESMVAENRAAELHSTYSQLDEQISRIADRIQKIKSVAEDFKPAE